MSGLRDVELDPRSNGTHAGLAAAREERHLPGRKRIMTGSKIASAKKLLAGGTPPADVAKDLSVSVPTLYRWVRGAPTMTVTQQGKSGFNS